MRTALTAALLVLASGAGALQNNVGASSSEFLRLGAGARALGMGEAYSAVAEGPDAAYWNPAGLARMNRPEVVYARSELPAGLHHDFLAAGVPSAFLHGTVALAVTRLSQQSLDLVNASNQVQGSFAPHSEVYSLAYGRGFWDTDAMKISRDYMRRGRDAVPVRRARDDDEPVDREIAGGVALKAITEDLGTRKAAVFAADGGVLLRPEALRGVIFAGAARHVGGKMRFISDSEPLPSELAASVAYDARAGDWRLLPAFEAAIPYAGNFYGKAGVEASRQVLPGLSIAGRLGYSSRTAPDLGVLSGLSAGVGLRAGGFSFDAAFQPMGLLGQTFRLGVGWKF